MPRLFGVRVKPSDAVKDPDVRELPRCKSGKHVWLDEADAAKCCNGFRRETHVRMLLGVPTYSFRWVKDD